jgi:hypothetical protein
LKERHIHTKEKKRKDGENEEEEGGSRDGAETRRE